MRVKSISVRAVATFAVTLFVFAIWASPAWAAAVLDVNKTGEPRTVVAGEDITYTIVVTNTGTDPASLTELFDDLPDEVDFVSVETTQGTCIGVEDPDPAFVDDVTCEFGTLDPDESATVTITATAAESGENLINRACAQSTTTDPPATDVCDTAATTIVPELEINKLDDPDPVSTEDTLLYTLRVTNVGGGTANNVTVSDFLDLDKIDFVAIAESGDFTCTREADVVSCTGSLAEGETQRIELIVEPEVAGTLENTATVGVGRFVIDEDTEITTVEDGDGGGNGDGNGNGDGTGDGNGDGTGDGTGDVLDTGETTNGDFKAADVAELSCEQILEISSSSDADQYGSDESFSAKRLEECRVAAVIDETIPTGKLSDTGGLPILRIAALLLIGAGIFMGRSVLFGGGGSRREE